jgi:DNA-binding HxlR family transcriptional regulator
VSPRIPEPEGGSALESRLREVARRHRRELFEPFVASLSEAPDLQREMLRIVESLQVFFNKWTVELIVVLAQGRVVRFNELRSQLPGISGRTLSQRLKELEEQGLVVRTVRDERPVRIEYALTKKGRDVAYLALPLVLYLSAPSRGPR